MFRPILLLAAASALAAPGVAFAQDEPELVITAPQPPKREPAVIQGPAPLPSQPTFRQAALNPLRIDAPIRADIRSRLDAPSADAIELPVKEEWVSNEGFRFTGSRLAFKRRF